MSPPCRAHRGKAASKPGHCPGPRTCGGLIPLRGGSIIRDQSVTVGASHAPPTDLTVATHISPLGAQPQSGGIFTRVHALRLVPGAQFMTLLDVLKRACRRSSLQASRSARRALSRIRVLRAVLRKHTPGSGTGAHARNRCECGDVGTRVWPHSDGTCLGTPARKRFQIWALFQPYPVNGKM